MRRLWLAGLLHSARFERWPALEPFQPCDLRTLGRYRLLQGRHLAQQPDDKRLQFSQGECVEVTGWSHPSRESEASVSGKRKPRCRHPFCRCYPDALLRLVQRGVKAPPERLRAALTGRVTEHHRFLLRLHLRQIDALEAAIAEIDQEVERDLDRFRQAVRLLRTIPGLSDLTAQVIVSEIGLDMSRFPTAGHLISWAGLCPRNDESAGKRRSTRLRKGAPWLKTTLVQCAWAGTRKKGSDLQAQFQRLRHRRGPKKAVCAVAASILTAAYHMLRDGTVYQDLGPDHLRRATPETQASRLARQITKLGFTCTLAPANKLVSV